MSIINNIENIKNMQIGDLIPCKYTATINKFGKFSELGNCTSNEINDLTNPDGLFYFKNVDKNLLIADRVIQNSISWNELNKNKLIDGLNINYATDIGIYNVTNSINYNPNVLAYQPKLCEYKNELYCCWVEPNNSNIRQLMIKKYNGKEWINISSSLNYSVIKNVFDPMLYLYKDELYCCWHEQYSSNAGEIMVKKYNGKEWITFANSLNYDSNKSAAKPMLCVYKDELYCCWMEYNNSNKYNFQIKKYNDIEWVNISTNYSSSYSIENPTLGVYKDELYVSWKQPKDLINPIIIKKYNGDIWLDVSTGLNYNISKRAENMQMCVYNNELYFCWQEHNNINIPQIMMKKYDGNQWSNISNSLNYNSTKIAYNPQSCVYKDELYCCWYEYNNSNIYQIMLKKYDGSNWISVSNSLNYNTINNATYPVICIYDNELYVCWQEQNTSNRYQTVVKRVVNNKIDATYTICTDKEYEQYTLNNNQTIYEWTKDISNITNTNRIIRQGHEIKESDYLEDSNEIGFRPMLIIK